MFVTLNHPTLSQLTVPSLPRPQLLWTLFMSMNDYPDFVVEEALRLLDRLLNTLLDDCVPLSRKFNELPPRPGIYAFKHQDLGILYIGKSTNIRARLRGGHKALGWAFIDRMDPDDVRIAYTTLSYQWNRVSYQLEQVMIGQIHPPYSDR